MNVLFIGDIVGSMGRDMIKDYLPRLKRKYHPDVVINGENAAGWKRDHKKDFSRFAMYGR